jgi:hypothetical protein
MTETEPHNRRLGSARVSTDGQALDAQLAELRREGCAKVYREKASGAQADRCELLRLLKALAPGDVVTVTRIDPASALDLRPFRHSHAGRGRGRAVPVIGGAVSREP